MYIYNVSQGVFEFFLRKNDDFSLQMFFKIARNAASEFLGKKKNICRPYSFDLS